MLRQNLALYLKLDWNLLCNLGYSWTPNPPALGMQGLQTMGVKISRFLERVKSGRCSNILTKMWGCGDISVVKGSCLQVDGMSLTLQHPQKTQQRVALMCVIPNMSMTVGGEDRRIQKLERQLGLHRSIVEAEDKQPWLSSDSHTDTLACICPYTNDTHTHTYTHLIKSK